MSVLYPEKEGFDRFVHIVNFPLGLFYLLLFITSYSPENHQMNLIFYFSWSIILPGWMSSIKYWYRNIYINIML
jgi:hypothetical protein